MKLSVYLRRRRLKNADFAEIVNVTPEAVRLWLKGTRVPNQNTMRRIVEATDGRVRPNDFFSASEAAA